MEALAAEILTCLQCGWTLKTLASCLLPTTQAPRHTMPPSPLNKRKRNKNVQKKKKVPRQDRLPKSSFILTVYAVYAALPAAPNRVLNGILYFLILKKSTLKTLIKWSLWTVLYTFLHIPAQSNGFYKLYPGWATSQLGAQASGSVPVSLSVTWDDNCTVLATNGGDRDALGSVSYTMATMSQSF